MRLSAVLFFAAAAALSAAPDPPAPATASGTFEDAKWKLEIAGAYAFWDETFGMGEGRAIRVAVSNTEFLPEAVDEHYDRGYAISTLFADEETKVVTFEFDESGKYNGLSYYFESGDGCGYCFDSKVKSTVRAAGGRLKGDLSYDGDGRKFQIALDVPIPPKSWGDPLPKDGGDPGKAFLAYHAALEKRDKKAILALSDADMKKRFQDYEKQGKLDAYLDYRWSRRAHEPQDDRDHGRIRPRRPRRRPVRREQRLHRAPPRRGPPPPRGRDVALPQGHGGGGDEGEVVFSFQFSVSELRTYD